jgi:hypothetical protein
MTEVKSSSHGNISRTIQSNTGGCNNDRKPKEKFFINIVQKKMAFRKTSETMEDFCLVISLIGVIKVIPHMMITRRRILLKSNGELLTEVE